MLLFWSLIVVTIVGILPQGSWITWRIRWMLDYTGCKERVVAWHFAQLEKLDSNFRLQRAEFKLVAARKGMDPRDPKYPDIFDFIEMPSLPPDFEKGLKKQGTKK